MSEAASPSTNSTSQQDFTAHTNRSVWKRTVGIAGRGLQVLWRWRLGWIFGHCLLVITHLGRRTGKRYRTVLYVQRYDRPTHEATVISVWGESQWFRNITSTPAARVEVGLQSYKPDQEFLSTEDIFDIEKRFRKQHRVIAWGQAKLMHWPWPATDEQLRELCAGLRGVRFAPSREVRASASPSSRPAR
jgi:deazaflavin-dependent oxidoreductase (nitroreductase family)